MRAISGKKLILWVSVSVTTTLPYGTVDDVKKDVKRCIEVVGKNRGGFFLASSSSIGPEVPLEKMLAMYKYGKIYGKNTEWRDKAAQNWQGKV